MLRLKPTLLPANTYSTHRILNLLTTAYADYFIPIHIDEAYFLRMCREEDITLHKSVIAHIHQTPVGLAFLSQRGTHGWISGVGVHPDWRRRGIGHAMIQYFQNTAPQHGMTHLRLETLTQNQAGQTLYQHQGFRWERDLLVLSADAGQVPLTQWSPYVQPTPAATLLQYYPTFHQTRAPWQRSFQSLKNRGPYLQGLGYWHKQKLSGYLLYETQTEDYAIYDLAVAPDCKHPLNIGKTLLSTLHTTRTDIGGYIINIPSENIITAAFTEMNYHIAHRQYEMAWQA